MQNTYKKRIFTPGILARDLGFMLKNGRKLAAARKNPTLSHAFTEKIMTVVTAVNGCVYCSWFHAMEASSAGVSESEINNLFTLQFDTEADEYELPALMYAQHYAETGRNPGREETATFTAHYGAETAEQIMLFIRIIFFGNLLGNTYDAFPSRLRGAPAPKSNVVFEFLFFIILFPLMFPASLVMKAQNKKKAKAAAE